MTDEIVKLFNLEAEQALLGAMLVNNEAFDKVNGMIRDDHFYEPVHQRIYKTIADGINRGEMIDPIRVKHIFENDDGLKDVGGPKYLVRLAGSAATIINAPDYAKTVLDLALRRNLRKALKLIADDAADIFDNNDISDVIDGIEAKLAEVIEDMSATKGSIIDVEFAVNEALEMINNADQEGNTDGISTGIAALDEIIGGFYATDLIIIGGRPGMGKTTLLTNFIRAIIEAGFRTVFFSLEMASKQIVTRMLSDLVLKHYGQKIAYSQARKGRISIGDKETMCRAGEYLQDLPLLIDDSSNISISRLRTSVKRLKKRFENTDKPLRIVAIDYLGLMKADDRYRGHKVHELEEVTKGLKALAKESEVTILLLCQLSRGLESRENKRPMLSDLRDSGSIEQDADAVFFCYSDSYYLEQTLQGISAGHRDYFDLTNKLNDANGKFELIVAKQRNGPRGVTAHLDISLECSAIRDRFEQSEMEYD